jgi:hypothetical protein
VAEASLLNPVAPVEFFVSDDGHLANQPRRWMTNAEAPLIR